MTGRGTTTIRLAAVLLMSSWTRPVSTTCPQPSFGGWLQPGPWARRHIIIPLDIAAGRLSYTISRQRRRKAQAAAERTNDPAAMTV